MLVTYVDLWLVNVGVAIVMSRKSNMRLHVYGQKKGGENRTLRDTTARYPAQREEKQHEDREDKEG